MTDQLPNSHTAATEPTSTGHLPPTTKHVVDHPTLKRFIATARGGDQLEYFRGFWARDPVEEHGRTIVAAYTSGRFELVQRRHGADDYSYILLARRRPDPKPRAWCYGAYPMPSGGNSRTAGLRNA